MSHRVRGLLDRLLTRRREAAGDGVSDAELLHRYSRDRDEAAFELLVWRHGPMVLGVCRRGVRDEQLAEDAFQAAFLVLARKAGAVRGNVGGWLFRVARRVSARAAARRPDVHPVTDVPAAVEPDPAERRELSELLDAEIARLPARLRGVVVLCYLGGRSTEDAARELGCPRGTVLSRLAAARARLADRLTRRGVTVPATLAAATVTHRTVSSAVAAARAFRAGTLSASAATQLATGVIRAMTRTTVLAAAGAVAFAALLTGVGWTAASGDGPAPTAQPKVAQERKADPPPAKDARLPVELEAQIKQLEELARTLAAQIPDKERELARVDPTARDRLQKAHAEAETELRQVNRDMARLKAEIGVLGKMIADPKGIPEPDAAFVRQAVADKTIQNRAERERLREFLNQEVQKSAGASSTYLDQLKASVARAEKDFAAAEGRAAAEAVESWRAAEVCKLRMRLSASETELKIKSAFADHLREECDVLAEKARRAAVDEERVTGLRQELATLRELIAASARAIHLARLKEKGILLTEPVGSESKLDAILRELAALRKEVQELKGQRR